MMKYIDDIRAWYDSRIVREKLLVLALCWAVIYLIFSLSLFKPLDREKSELSLQIRENENQIATWDTQINALKKIPNTPLYKEWIKHRESLQALEGQYQIYLKESPSKQWANVIKAILQSQHNVILVEIKNLPETSYNPPQANVTAKKLYEQLLQVTVLSNFNDTVKYIQHLENLLPNLHWNKLTYDVTQYPIAKVQMEFSIIYEKS